MIFSSSSKDKVREYKTLLGKNITIIDDGKDLPEVNGTMDEVIVHKSIDAGKGMLVEDTILIIDGIEVVTIRWNQEDKMKNAKTAQWVVSLAYNDGEKIFVYRGIINGTIVSPVGTGFGFDPYFLPENSELTLAQLDQRGKKEAYSARKLAVIKLQDKKPVIVSAIADIPTWIGDYQKD